MRSLTAKWFFEMAGSPSAVFVFDDDPPSYRAGNLRKSKRRTVVESCECCTCIQRYFLQIWPAALLGVVPRLVEGTCAS